MSVVGPVREAAGGVDRKALGVAEAPHVGSEEAIAVGRAGHHVLVEAGGGQVAVDQDHGRAVGGARFQVMDPETVGRDLLRAHT
jgi:hypothetical protein